MQYVTDLEDNSQEAHSPPKQRHSLYNAVLNGNLERAEKADASSTALLDRLTVIERSLDRIATLLEPLKQLSASVASIKHDLLAIRQSHTNISTPPSAVESSFDSSFFGMTMLSECSGATGPQASAEKTQDEETTRASALIAHEEKTAVTPIEVLQTRNTGTTA